MTITEKLPSLNKFWRILRNHDWTYEYSDDHNVWRRGSAELSFIRSIVEQGGEDYKKLFEEYSEYAWRKDNSIKEPLRPQPSKEQQIEDLNTLREIGERLEDICKELWEIEASQITFVDQLWNITNPLSSMLNKTRDIIEEKSKSPMWDTVAFKGYKRIKEHLDHI